MEGQKAELGGVQSRKSHDAHLGTPKVMLVSTHSSVSSQIPSGHDPDNRIRTPELLRGGLCTSESDIQPLVRKATTFWAPFPKRWQVVSPKKQAAQMAKSPQHHIARGGERKKRLQG